MVSRVKECHGHSSTSTSQAVNYMDVMVCQVQGRHAQSSTWTSQSVMYSISLGSNLSKMLVVFLLNCLCFIVRQIWVIQFRLLFVENFSIPDVTWQISWVRRQDVVILSHGTTVFTSDSRFSVSPSLGQPLLSLFQSTYNVFVSWFSVFCSIQTSEIC